MDGGQHATLVRGWKGHGHPSVELALRTIQSEGSRGSYRETQGSQEYQFCEAALYLTIRTRVMPAIDIQCVLEKLESDAEFHTHQFLK